MQLLHSRIPILHRSLNKRDRVLAILATSATTERLFSVGSRVWTFGRASLPPASVDTLTTLHSWEMSGDDESKRAQLRNAKDDRFCKVKFDEEAGTLTILMILRMTSVRTPPSKN